MELLMCFSLPWLKNKHGRLFVLLFKFEHCRVKKYISLLSIYIRLSLWNIVNRFKPFDLEGGAQFQPM